MIAVALVMVMAVLAAEIGWLMVAPAFSDRAKPARARWPALSWSVLGPVVLVGNVALAIVAWYAVELIMRVF
jgi:hypothetical protein